MNEQDKKVPTLRFKGFTNDWEQHKLGDIANIGDGLHGTPKYDANGKYHFINGNNLIDGKIQITKETKRVSYSALSDYDKSLDNLTLLMSINGTIGQLAFYNKEPIKLGKSVAYIRFGNLSTLSFYYGALMASNTQQYFNRRVTGTTIKNLGLNEIRNFKYPIPSETEQKKIGKLIKLLNATITLQQRKLDLLKQLKKGLLQKMFADKDSKRPVLRFKGFHDDWEQRKLSELIQKGGSGGTPKSTNKAYYNGNIPFLGISDISKSNGYIDDTEKYISEKGLDNSSAWIVPKGAISLAMYASVGKLAILNTDAATSQAFYNMVFEDVSIRDYVYHRLGKANEFGEWTRLISTGTQSNLNADKVKNFRIQIPQIIDEIKNISTFFNQLDSLIALHQRKQNHLKLLKKSLLQQMFM